MKNKFSRFLSSNKFIVLFSLIASFVLWFSLASQNIRQVSIAKNITISWDASVNSMQQNYEDFDVITVDGKLPSEFKKVSVTVIGAASSVGSITDKKIIDKLGLETNKWGNIKVDENYKTSDDKIYAIGDVAGVKQTVAWAARSGFNCAKGIANFDKIVN